MKATDGVLTRHPYTRPAGAANDIDVHSIGNGHIGAYCRGADILDLFAPYYSAPTLAVLRLETPCECVSRRLAGTGVWSGALTAENGAHGAFRDCTVAGEAALLRVFDCEAPVELTLARRAVRGFEPIHPSLLAGTGCNAAAGGYVPAGTLFYINWRRENGEEQGYPIPDRIYMLACVLGDGTLACRDGDARVTVGRGSLLLLAARDETEAWSTLHRVAARPPEEWYAACVAEWRSFTEARLRNAPPLPETDTLARAVNEAADDIAVLLATQQDAGGGILAGCNYHLSYVRDNYGDFRGLMAAGCFAEARRLLLYYADVYARYGAIHTAQGMGCFAFHVHEHDFAENTGYLALMAFEYYERTGDGDTLASCLPFVRWALEAQRAGLLGGVLPFSGDETYIAGGVLPRDCIGDGSMEATLLYHRAIERMLPLAARFDEAFAERQRLAKAEIERAFAATFLGADGLACNAPGAWDAGERMRPGVRQCGHGFGSSYYNMYSGKFVCAACLDRRDPPAEPRVFRLLSTAFVPLYIGAALVPAETLAGMVREAFGAWRATGRLPSQPDSPLTVGYDYGMLLGALAATGADGADICAFAEATLAVRDRTGAWVEYYRDGEPTGTPCRPWESGVCLAALRAALAADRA